MRLSFDTLISRSNTGVLLALLIKYRKQHVTKNAIIFYVQEIKFRRDDLVAQNNLSALVNIAKYMYMYTLFEYKTKYTNWLAEEGMSKIKSMLFQAIAICRL